MAPDKGGSDLHSYRWYDGHTRYHHRPCRYGLLLTEEEHAELMRAYEKQELLRATSRAYAVMEQKIRKVPPLYDEYPTPYGQLDSTQPFPLKFYKFLPMRRASAAAESLVRQHGYTARHAGRSHGRPDLHSMNYNTKDLWLWEDSAESGCSFAVRLYTETWRKLHELAHALTVDSLNAIHGEGRRVGALGRQMTWQALRAVHWEHLAVMKQRELSAQIQEHISDDDFNREYNTVMLDAVHRAITGEMIEPSREGFVPHAHRIPLETSLGLVRAAASSGG